MLHTSRRLAPLCPAYHELCLPPDVYMFNMLTLFLHLVSSLFVTSIPAMPATRVYLYVTVFTIFFSTGWKNCPHVHFQRGTQQNCNTSCWERSSCQPPRQGTSMNNKLDGSGTKARICVTMGHTPDQQNSVPSIGRGALPFNFCVRACVNKENTFWGPLWHMYLLVFSSVVRKGGAELPVFVLLIACILFPLLLA